MVITNKNNMAFTYGDNRTEFDEVFHLADIAKANYLVSEEIRRVEIVEQGYKLAERYIQATRFMKDENQSQPEFPSYGIKILLSSYNETILDKHHHNINAIISTFTRALVSCDIRFVLQFNGVGFDKDIVYLDSSSRLSETNSLILKLKEYIDTSDMDATTMTVSALYILPVKNGAVVGDIYDHTQFIAPDSFDLAVNIFLKKISRHWFLPKNAYRDDKNFESTISDILAEMFISMITNEKAIIVTT
jgi:hypothetical protein